MKWIPGRSHLVGVSCFFYLLPALWGLCPLFFIQVLCSLMSDYIMTGKDSNTIARAAIPFFVMLLVCIGLITAFPEIVTWLPDRLMGKET